MAFHLLKPGRLMENASKVATMCSSSCESQGYIRAVPGFSLA